MAAKRNTRSTSRRTSGKRKPVARKNKRLQAQGMNIPVGLSAMILVLTILTLSSLWISSGNDGLASKIELKKVELKNLRGEVNEEEARWNNLISSSRIHQAMAKHDLQMTWPRPEQVVHVRDMNLWVANEGRVNVYGRLDEPRGSPMP